MKYVCLPETGKQGQQETIEARDLRMKEIKNTDSLSSNLSRSHAEYESTTCSVVRR